MTATTNAATAKISTTSSLLESDPLLTLILTLSPPHQLTLDITTVTARTTASGNDTGNATKGGKKGSKKQKGAGKKRSGDTPPPPPQTQSSPSPGSLSLELNGGDTTLTQRNAVLRSLCGSAFHNALDSGGPGSYRLLGGYSASSVSSRSPEAAMVLAGLSSWMSVAGTIRGGGGVDDLRKMCGDLNGALAARSFLCGETVGQPTLADLDVFFAIVSALSRTRNGEEKEEEYSPTKGNPNLKRWMKQCGAAVARMVEGVDKVPSQKGLPDVALPEDVMDELGVGDKVAEPAPTFVYSRSETTAAATDAAGAAATPTTGTAPATATGTAATTGEKSAATAEGGITDEQKKIAADKRAAKKAQKDANRKKAAAATAATTKQTPPATDTLTVSALDIRIGKILSCHPHEASEKLWVEQVDVGEPQPRQILSGLRRFYTLEEMSTQGHVLVLCNLKKRNLVGVPSHGMVLCASNADHTAVEFVVPPRNGGAPPRVGERVVFEGYEEGDPEPENKLAKKKMFEKLAPDLRTDGDGVVVWKGAKSVTSGGPCVASKLMKGANVS